MSEFSLPTPKEAGYFNDPKVDSALYTIQKAIASRKWAFHPAPNWNSIDMFPRINEEIGKFGWKIAREWYGSNDDGYDLWKVVPV